VPTNSRYITVFDFSARNFAKELEAVNQTTAAFSRVEPPEVNGSGFGAGPESMTIVVAGINGLTLLLNTILIVLAKRKAGIVEITTNGRTLKFPSNTPPDEVQRLIGVAESLDGVRKLIVSAGP
jgi:hypothetical protein